MRAVPTKVERVAISALAAAALQSAYLCLRGSIHPYHIENKPIPSALGEDVVAAFAPKTGGDSTSPRLRFAIVLRLRAIQ